MNSTHYIRKLSSILSVAAFACGIAGCSGEDRTPEVDKSTTAPASTGTSGSDGSIGSGTTSIETATSSITELPSDSTSSTLESTSAEALNPPLTLSASHIMKTRASIGWIVPAELENAPYTISVFVEETGFERSDLVATQYMVTGLVPGSTFNIKIVAKNLNNQELYEGSIEIMTPGSPGDSLLEIADVQDTRFIIKWLGAFVGAPPKHFLLSLDGKEAGQVTSSEYSYGFTGLEPNTKYTAKVTAVFEEGDNREWSEEIEVTTLAGS